MPDISHTITAKSDQLNAGDLAAPVVVEVRAVRVVNEEQPVHVELVGPYQPWKPCKGMRRLLAQSWGTNTDTWIGHRVELYCDRSVTWAGQAVGGIRVSAISGIEKPLRYVMRTSKKGTTTYEVRPLERGKTLEDVRARAGLLDYAAGRDVTREQIDAFLAEHGTNLEDLDAASLRTLGKDLERVREHAASVSAAG
jgi:hypothetical protein